MNPNNVITANGVLNLPPVFPEMSALRSTQVYLMGCRSFKQFCSTLRALVVPEEYCPFCPKELKRRERVPEASIGRWHLLRNEFPHRNVKQMWLIVPDGHVTDPDNLTDNDWANLGRIVHRCRRQCGIRSGGVMLRFGDPCFNVGTVEHLHVNIIEPIPGKEFRAPFAKHMPEHEEDYGRLLGLRDELKAKGGAEWLFSDEGIRETQP